MSAIKSFFEKTFFMSGTEGIILLIVCIVAIVCTIVVIALSVMVVLSVKRRKYEVGNEKVSETVEETAPDVQTEVVTEDTTSELLAETSEETSTGVVEQAPVITSAKKVKIAHGTAFVSMRYDKSFTAKLIQSDDEVKSWYSSLKNALLGYKKVSSRISWRTDSINRGRIKLAKFAIRGKTLRLYLALNPDDYADTKYKVERTENKRYEEVPCLYKIKNARRAKYALELIATLAAKFELQPMEREQVNYYLPFEENEPLLERGLIKEIVYKADEPVQVEEDSEVVEEVATTEENIPMRTILPFDKNAVRYNRSFTAKLIQSEDEVKTWYAELKNALLSYKKIKVRRSWKRESYRLGRRIVVRFAFRGRTLCVYFALNFNELEESKYKVEAVEVASYIDTPCMYRIKNRRRMRYAKELIDIVMENIGVVRKEEYTPEEVYLPYEDTESLIEKGLIKVVKVTPRPFVSQDPDGAVEEVTEEVFSETDEVAFTEVFNEKPTEEPIENPEIEEQSDEELDDIAISEEPEEKYQPAEEETVAEITVEQPIEEAEEISEEVAESEPMEEPIENPEVEEQSVEELDDIAISEEPEEEYQPAEEETVAETTEEHPVEEISEEVTESEPMEEPIENSEVEALSVEKLVDIAISEELANDEDGIEVVGVMFRRRGRKVYWFDPDGRTWTKGEIALHYITPNIPPQEVIVVGSAKISPSKLHLPLKPLHKVPASQTENRQKAKIRG